MNFRKHLNLKGLHAILGASKYHWIYYDNEKIKNFYKNQQAIKRGTELHEFAERCINLRQKLPKANKALNCYVNDAIKFNMTAEQILYYSENCFGTADAISFHKRILRIHDLKTGTNEGHMQQLEIYAALFCLEYDVDPRSIEIILRIYQYDGYKEENPDVDEILDIMKKIEVFDGIIENQKDNEE